jgi:hypothetical protein
MRIVIPGGRVKSEGACNGRQRDLPDYPAASANDKALLGRESKVERDEGQAKVEGESICERSEQLGEKGE